MQQGKCEKIQFPNGRLPLAGEAGQPRRNSATDDVTRNFRGQLMARTQQDLLDFLGGLGITVSTVSHPPLFTVADSQTLRGEIAGGHTKNLFLKDRKDRYFLLVVEEDGEVDLKQIHHVIGASGKVSFGKPEKLLEYLGVTPGAVTAFGVFNDAENAVTIIFDEALMRHDVVNAHPLTNEATTSIAREDLVRFVEATGHPVSVLKLTV
jgi:Ala-tRNA(Pro) deacylase